jgi:hypothetical protein
MQSPWSVGVGTGVSEGVIVAEGEAEGPGVLVAGIVVGVTLGSGVAVVVEPQALDNTAVIRKMINPTFFIFILTILDRSGGRQNDKKFMDNLHINNITNTVRFCNHLILLGRFPAFI